MRKRLFFGALTLALGSLAVPAAALAAPPIGTCPPVYTQLTREEVAQLPGDPALALEVFDIVNLNGDAYVCYRAFPNGLHHGHSGNFIDNVGVRNN